MKPSTSRSTLPAFGLALCAALTFLTGCSFAAPTASKDGTQLSKNGVATQKVIVSTNATERTRAAASTLADYLGRISGAKFVVGTGDGNSGIAVGTASDFPALNLQKSFDPAEPLRREEFLLRSHDKGVLLIGATELAVEDAVWELLDRLGYRQFFPGETWEVVPSTPSLSIAVNKTIKPDFHTRLIWYGHGMWGYNEKPYNDWMARNRALKAFELNTAHSYGYIIRTNKEVFEEHPEYLALIDGKRGGSKFCLSNPDLRKFVVEKYALEYFRKNPEADSVSLEPSDGGDWCECDQCKAMGSISNRVVALANEAAVAINKEFPGKYVGMLAYNEHSPPPTIKVDPHVLIKVQTSFIRGGYTVDQLMQGWQKQGASIGVGEYYSVFAKDKSRPAAQMGSDLHHIKTAIPHFKENGAQFFMAESSDAWGAIGLGHYIAARLIWDSSQASNLDALIDDFLTKSFGPAKAPMSDFYHAIYLFDKDDMRPMIRGDMLARMYRALDAAKKLAGDDAKINARLDDLLLFTRYEELYQQMEDAGGARKQKALDDLLTHTYRMRETMMVHAKPITMHLARRTGLKQPPKENYEVDTPFEPAELQRMLTEGVANTKLVDVGFKPVAFSRDLVPATPLHLPEVQRGNFNSVAPMGEQNFMTWLNAPGEVKLKISGGHIVHYRNISSNVQARLYAEANPEVGEEVAYDDSIAPDGVMRELSLKSPFEGLHQIKVVSPSNRAMVDNEPSTPLTMEASLDESNQFSSFWSMYFYVPKGTKIVGGFAANSSGTILDGDGKPVFDFSKIETPGYFKVEVPAGQDGKLWKFNKVRGQRLLLTVPPFLARSGQELLLPKEVVEADAK
jgi:hypothetical protein